MPTRGRERSEHTARTRALRAARRVHQPRPTIQDVSDALAVIHNTLTAGVPVRYQHKIAGGGFPGPVRTGMIYVQHDKVIGLRSSDNEELLRGEICMDTRQPRGCVATGTFDAGPLGPMVEGWAFETTSGQPLFEFRETAIRLLECERCARALEAQGFTDVSL